MCPDVETFAPLVAASFGMTDEPGGHPAARLRVKLADRSLRQTNPLLDLLSKLLELAASRVTATQLLDLAGVGPVRRRFGFDDDDIERLRDWTVSAGARWGLDANHRGDYGLSGIGQGTWRVAVDRLLLGVAMEDDDAWLGETLPLDDVDSGDIDLAGRFAELVDRVDDAVRTLDEKRPVPDWARTLDELVRSLGRGRRGLAGDAAAPRARRGRRERRGHRRRTRARRRHRTAASRLAGRPTRASFRTGTLTVCTLVPMRSVPHRVVCLLGMDDGAFPRQGVADGDDMLAREPRSGERDVRSEDRQLFLDAICAAQEHLVITYTGADPRSGAEVPPCVPLGELLDAVDATAVAPGGVGPPGTTSSCATRCSRSTAATSCRTSSERPVRSRSIRPASPEPAPPTGRGRQCRHSCRRRSRPPPTTTVNLEDLVRFLQHPVRGFLRQRLDISTAVGDDDPDDAITVELDGLQNWAIGDRVLRRCLAGTPRDTAARLEYLRGELPPGPLGAQAMRAIGARVDALLHASELERRTEASSVEVAVPLDGRPRRCPGRSPACADRRILTVTYSTLAAETSAQLVGALPRGGRDHRDAGCRAVTVGRRRDGARRSILHGVDAAVARRVLDLLVAHPRRRAARAAAARPRDVRASTRPAGIGASSIGDALAERRS